MAPRALTLTDFAELPRAWPEYIHGVSTHHLSGGGTLIARIHPNCNRSSGDEDVLVRALVFMTDEVGTSLSRLTIRRSHVEMTDGKASETDRVHAEETAKAYRECLYAIWDLPVLELTDRPDQT